MENSGLQVASGTYGLLVNAVAKMGDLSRVERIFKRMEQAKVEVSGSTFNALISSCARQVDLKM